MRNYSHLVLEILDANPVVGTKRKIRLAARIRRETTLSLKWIAEHLAMGSWTHVSNLCGAEGKRRSSKSVN
jgi:hypothetical protein